MSIFLKVLKYSFKPVFAMNWMWAMYNLFTNAVCTTLSLSLCISVMHFFQPSPLRLVTACFCRSVEGSFKDRFKPFSHSVSMLIIGPMCLPKSADTEWTLLKDRIWEGWLKCVWKLAKAFLPGSSWQDGRKFSEVNNVPIFSKPEIQGGHTRSRV